MAFRNRRTSRTNGIFAGTALASAIVFAPPAMADNECGPAVNDVAVCAPANGPFPSGIAYRPITVNPFTLRLLPGTVVNQINDDAGIGAAIFLRGVGGPLTIDGAGVNVSASAAPEGAVFIRGTGSSPTSITLGNVTNTTTTGAYSGQAIAIFGGGSATINVGDVSSAGTVAGSNYYNAVVSVDVLRTQDYSSATVTTGAVTATGERMKGIAVGIRTPAFGDIAVTANGPINVTSTGIQTNSSSTGRTTIVVNGAFNAGGRGIDAFAAQSGSISITANANIVAGGDTGVRASNIGGGDISVNTRSVTGVSHGIRAISQDFLSATGRSGNVAITIADGSVVQGEKAVRATASNSDIVVTGRGATLNGIGGESGGVELRVFDGAGSAQLDVGTVNIATALPRFTDYYGNVYANEGVVVDARGSGSASARIGTFNAAPTALLDYGVSADAVSGDAAIVITNRANGSADISLLDAFSSSGRASVDSSGATVAQTGTGIGIFVRSLTGPSAAITAGTTTSGPGAALVALTNQGLASVVAGSTTSTGRAAIIARGDRAAVTTTGQTQTGTAGGVAIEAQAISGASVRSAAIDAAGGGISAQAAGAVTVETSGAITARNGAGISTASAGGGATSVTVGGAITATNGGGVVVLQGPGTAPVNVAINAPVTATGNGNSAVSVTNGGSGATTVGIAANVGANGTATPAVLVQSASAPQSVTVAPGAAITASGLNGIGLQMQTAGAAPIIVNLNGNVVQSSTAGAGTGVLIQSAGTAPITFNQGGASAVTANGGAAAGVELASYGAVTVNSSGTIRTPGAETIALSVRGGGPVSMTTGTVSSGGFGIYGVSATSLNLTTTGATSAVGRGIQASVAGTTGDVVVTTNGAVTLTPSPFPISAVGLLVGQQNAASTGATRVMTNGAVTVTASNALGVSGILATTIGTGAVAVAVNGNVTATSTSGASSSAVIASSRGGATTITQAASSNVTVTGGGTALNAVSGLDASTTTGAITINSAGTVVLNNNGVQQSAAISARTGTGAITINQTGRVTANGANSFGIGALRSGAGLTTINANNVIATTPGFGFGIGVQGGSAAITVAAGGTVNGGGAGIILLGTGASTITNNGVVRALSNFAIDASNAAGGVTISNAAGAEIVGGVNLSGFADTLTNAGTFTAQGVNSNFGAGTDTFTNSGLVRLGASAAPVSLAFQNLETFSNLASGTIDLRQGAAGNALAMPGTAYSGAAGSRLLVNAFLGAPGSVSDRLVVGTASGTTAIVVTDTNTGAGAYNPLGMLVVSTAAGTPASSFTLAQPINKGLWDYHLQRNAAGTEFRLASTAGVAAYELALLPAAVRDMWHHSVAPFADRLSELGSDGARSARTSLWLRANVTSGDRDVGAAAALAVSGTALAPYDLSSDQATTAISVGIDRTVPSGAGQLSFGVGGGWTSNRTRFDRTLDRFTTEGASVTGYVGWSGKALFATLVAHANFATTDMNIARVGNYRTEADSWGAKLATGYRAAFAGGFYLEPQASIAYVNSKIDGLVIQSTGVAFADVDSWRARGAMRAGKTWTSGSTDWNLYASAGIDHEFGSVPGVALLSGPGLLIPDNGDFSSGVFGAGLEVQDRSRGISGFLRGDYTGLNSDQWQGASVRLGVRFALGGSGR